MHRTTNAFSRRSPSPAPASELAWRLWSWLGPRLAAMLSAWGRRAVRFVEGEGGRLAFGAFIRRSRDAMRKARENDTVPAGTLKRALNRYEERKVAAARRQAEREQRRLRHEAEKKAREQRYSEKSSIYLG